MLDATIPGDALPGGKEQSTMDLHPGLKNQYRSISFTYIPIHSPLLKESWLVSSFALRWLICLSLARSLAWAEANKCV